MNPTSNNQKPPPTEKLPDELLKIIWMRAALRFIKSLDKETLKKIETLLAVPNKSDEEKIQFLREAIPDFDKIIVEEMKKIRLELESLTKGKQE